MRNEALLDTSFLVELLRGEQRIEWEILNSFKCHANAIVLGELEYGALRSNRMEYGLLQIMELFAAIKMVGMGTRTSAVSSQIKANLAQRGSLIPENDMWIAASAMEHGMVLVTQDRHFERVVDLDLHWI